jgi:hypothetical protein
MTILRVFINAELIQGFRLMTFRAGLALREFHEASYSGVCGMSGLSRE